MRTAFPGRFLCVTLLSLTLVPQFVSAQTGPRVYRDAVDPHWSADRTRFWYRNDLPRGQREFILVEAEKGTRVPAFDHDRLAAALGKLLKKKLDAGKLPIDELDFDRDGGLLVRGPDGAWHLDLVTYTLKETDAKPRDTSALQPLDRPRPSKTGGPVTNLAFVNQTDKPIDVYWLDEKGNRKHYAKVAAGKTWTIETFAGHTWLVVGPDDKPLGVYEAARSPARVLIERRPPVRPEVEEEEDLPRRHGDTEALSQFERLNANRLLIRDGFWDFNATSVPPCLRGEPSSALADKLLLDVYPDDANPDAAKPDRKPSGRRGRRGSSPDGKWSVVVKENNLWLRSSETGEESQLSRDGKAEDAYDAGRVWWSPDGKQLVAFRTEPAQEHKVVFVEAKPSGQVQPKVHENNYLKPGDKIAHPRPQLFLIDSKKQIALKDELFPNPWSIDDVRWSADSSRFTFLYNQRGHQVLRIVAIDASTGEATSIVDETTKTFICYSGKSFTHWLGDDELIWMSERDGWNHLWLYDAKNGKLKNQITRGKWVVQSVKHVDEKNRQIWFTAGGVRDGQDPYFSHFCRVNFDGTGFTVLTEGDGQHAVKWTPGDKWFVDTYSRVDLPPVSELRKCDDGFLVCKLEEADASEVLAARGGKWPMRFTAKGRDGSTDIFGVIWLPKDFDPKAKYPVIENIYAGPHGFFTPKAFRKSYGVRQTLADKGAIIVQCDGMGTNGRSKAFHDVCWKNIKDAGFPDRIAWITAAGKQVAQMDLTRVGIYGGSAGGQNALAALLWHNDFYKVAVADCGCHDNRMDKIWWNEQWMGWPIDKAYEESSNVVNAKLLQGKLLLIVGEVDTNVDPASTLQVSAALQKANKDYELIIVAGSNHGAAETPYGSRKRAEFLMKHLQFGDGSK